MSGETKRRLLLSKWRGQLETLRDNATTHKEEINERDEKIGDLEATVKEVEEDLEAAREAHLDEIRDLTETLDAVRWWMHEPLVLHMPMRNPRVILRKIEDVLG